MGDRSWEFGKSMEGEKAGGGGPLGDFLAHL